MEVYENDKLIIPEKYKKMSMSEIEREKNKLLKEILLSERQKKVIKSNKNNITFNF